MSIKVKPKTEPITLTSSWTLTSKQTMQKIRLSVLSNTTNTDLFSKCTCQIVQHNAVLRLLMFSENCMHTAKKVTQATRKPRTLQCHRLITPTYKNDNSHQVCFCFSLNGIGLINHNLTVKNYLTCKSIFSHLSWKRSWASKVKDGDGIFPPFLLAAKAACPTHKKQRHFKIEKKIVNF